MRDHNNIQVASPPERYILRASLLFLGSYVFGFLLSRILHELGHSAAVLVQGGAVTGYRFHPFDPCYNYSTFVPNHILLYAGGAYIGGLVTVVFPLLAWEYRSPYMVPLIMTCAPGLITTGFHMLVDRFWFLQSDYVFMVNLGVPSVLIILSGILFIVLGLGIRIIYLPLLGIPYNASFLQRCAIYSLGMLPYYLATGGYNIFVHHYSAAHLISLLAPGIVFLLVEAAVSVCLQRHVRFFRSIPVIPVTRAHIVAAWSLAVAVIVFMLVFPEGSPPVPE